MHRFFSCLFRLFFAPWVLTEKIIAAAWRFDWLLGGITSILLSPIWLPFICILAMVAAISGMIRFFQRQIVYLRATEEQREKLGNLQVATDNYRRPATRGYSFCTEEKDIQRATNRCLDAGVTPSDLRPFLPLN